MLEIRKAVFGLKIYISGAITGTEDYMSRFFNAEEKLEELGYTVVNPAKVNNMLPTKTTHEEYMKMSFCMLDMCDYVYMLDNWKQSCGASQEYGYAVAKGKKIIYQTELEE